MTRGEQLATAYEAVARVNHYMVGIVETVTDDELAEAEQILITRQNNLPRVDRAPYRRLSLALTLIEHEQRRRTIAASHGG